MILPSLLLFNLLKEQTPELFGASLFKMKKLILGIIILFTCNFVFGQGVQQKPLSQAEYVQMLYQIEQSPAKKQALIAAIRSRGIDFKLTSGLRSLTISKGRNDTELKRTVEEANRRRENPEAAKLPSLKEAKEILEKTRVNTLAAVDEMPDFVVKQRIKRSAAYAGTGNYRSLDRLIVAVSYQADGREKYRLLSKNGVRQVNKESKSGYSEAGGTSSTGEFVTVLATVFKPESDTRFKVIDTDLVRKNRAIVYEFSVEKIKAKQQITSYGYIADSTTSGMKGKIWIDRDRARVLRIESIATEIPADFPVRAASRTINYDWVSISGEKYLLPTLSDVRLTFRQNRKLFESRNLIHFKDYQKFGTEVIILDDDDEEIIEDEAAKDSDEKPKEVKPVEPK